MLIANEQATNKQKTQNVFVGSVRLPKLEKITHEKRRRASQVTLKIKTSSLHGFEKADGVC